MDPSEVADFRDRVRVVLVRPLRMGNVGSAARAMKNMGLRHLVLVSPQEDRPDLARRMAPGAHDLLETAQVVETTAEAVAGCRWIVGTTVRARKLRWPILEPAQLAKQVFETEGDIALLFGPEDSGLDNEDLLLCHALATIPTDEAPSLNLAQAVLLLAHHIFEEARRRGYRPPPRRRRSRRGGRELPSQPQPHTPGAGELPAPAEMTIAVARRAVGLLARTSYLAGKSPDQVQLTLYHLLQRARPTVREVSILLGMEKKLDWTLDHPGEGEGEE